MARSGKKRAKQRGVRASRVRLERALLASDLEKKTQIALANRIADFEELDAAPRDLVNRIFREQPVDVKSIARVARALGVEAESLYADAAQRRASGAEPPAGPVSRVRVAGVATGLGIGVAFLIAAYLLPVAADLRCRVTEWLAPPAAQEQRIGVVVARFDGSGGEAAQALLARSLVGDRALGGTLSVMTTCRHFALFGGSGPIETRKRKLRDRARSLLEASGAKMLLWGDVEGNRALVRFVSLRTDLAPVSLLVGARSVAIAEDQVEVPVALDRVADALGEVTAMLLGLMVVDEPKLAALRRQAMQANAMSFDWLRSSVISLRNRRRSMDAALDPRLWGIVNNRLCYEERLLGDVEGDGTHYIAAANACRDALAARPRELDPVDWARTSVNLASALIRQHNFASNRTESVALLESAISTLVAATQALDRHLLPQLWALAQRNLGVAYERLGELGQGADSDRAFDEAKQVMDGALSVLNPDFQPVDWAITQQNYCLALYQQGIRHGAAGRPLVAEARRRCALALERLDPERTPLEWAMVENNYAVTLAIQGEMESDPALLREARRVLAEAQRVYTRAVLPLNWTEVEINLAELSCNIARLEGDASELGRATAHAEAALQILIEKGQRKYRSYTEGLLRAITACRDEGLEGCVCRPI